MHNLWIWSSSDKNVFVALRVNEVTLLTEIIVFFDISQCASVICICSIQFFGT